jgi:SnoaL-like domain
MLPPPIVVAHANAAGIFRYFIEARNHGDVDRAAALFTDDAFFEGRQCHPCIGTTGTRREIERRVAEQIYSRIIGAEVSGNTAKIRIQVSTAEMRAKEAASNVAIASVEVRGTLLSSVRFRLVSLVTRVRVKRT